MVLLVSCMDFHGLVVSRHSCLKTNSDTSAEARVARSSDGKPYPRECCSWKVTFHKGLLVGSDSRKNLSMVLLVSREIFFGPCMDFHGLVVSRDTTLYGFSWSSGVT